MGRAKDTLKATGASTLILIASIAEALDECRDPQLAVCGMESPILPHSHEGDPIVPQPFRLLMIGTNTGTGADTSSPPPPQDVPHVFWEQDGEDWNFAVQENLRIQRNYIAPLVQPFVVTGTQVGAGAWD